MRSVSLKPGSVRDPEVASTLRKYKRSVASRYRLLSTGSAESLPRGPLFASTKVDGELWFLIRTETGAMLASHNGRTITDGTDILKEEVFLSRAEPGTILAGELFDTSGPGRPRVGGVGRALRGDLAPLRFKAFDVVGEFEEYPEKLKTIRHLLQDGEFASPMETWRVRSSGVQALIDEHVSSGNHEGLIVRSKRGGIFKMKPSFTVDCAVIGYTERTEDPDQVSSLLVGLIREDDLVQVVGRVGNLGTEDNRRELMEWVSPLKISSHYRTADRKGAIYQMVHNPDLVIEVCITDVQPDARQMVLTMDPEGGYASTAKVEGAAMLHPVFVRARKDKCFDRVDCRISQVLDRCDMKPRPVVKEALRPSEIIRREVYSKEVSGNVCVRKLVVWKTNKGSHEFPHYVTHFTDYSPGRKDPLKRTVRLAPTQDLANEIADAMITANIKRGWDLV